jgi:hypothetical protein
MSFTYRAGGTTPNLEGLVEVGSIRINGTSDGTYDGTFELHGFAGVFDGQAPIRDYMSDLPNDHGGVPGLALNGPRVGLLEGQLSVPVLADIDGARDLLNQTFDLDAGLQVYTLDRPGWSAKRQITAQVIGDGVKVEQPPGLSKLIPDRLFSVAVVAPDPRIYSVTEHTQTITTNTSITNAGIRSTPVKVRFNGPQTNPKIDLHGTSGSARIRFAGTITSGHYVEVNANAASEDGVYAIDDTGVNAMGTDSAYGGPISAFTLRKIPAGSSAYDATNDSGAGTTVVYWRDAW